MPNNAALEHTLASYYALLKEKGDSIDVLHAIAILHAQLNQLDDALNYVQKALNYEPNNIKLLNSAGNIHLARQEFTAAINTYQLALTLDPHYAIAYNGLGKCFYQQHDFTAAEKNFTKALELNSQYSEASYNYALILSKKEHWEAAIAQLEPLIQRNPDFISALNLLGNLYLKTDKPEKALLILDHHAHLQPEHAEANHSLAQALLLTNHLPEAITFYEKTLMINPKHPEVNQNLAHAYMTIGDHHKALNYYFRQLEIQPLMESYYNIGVLMMYQERNKEALHYLHEAVRLDATTLAGYLNLGAIYLKLQDYPKAIENYKIALTLNPENKELNYIIDALSEANLSERAPNDYLQNLFNQYAHYYDKHLTHYLKYEVPEQLEKLVFNEVGDTRMHWRVLDLGCGTGLSGLAFKKYADTLIGIDISEKMLEVAKKKNIYDELRAEDIETAVLAYENIDLIIAADVFSYIGNLDTIFKNSYAALAPKGLFAFSVEKSAGQDFVLQKTLRYAHTEKYVKKLAQKNNFSVKCLKQTILRKQQKQMIEGYLFLLSRDI